LKTVFRASFGRDVKRIRSDRILAGVRQAILDAEAASSWSEVPNIKKIRGSDNAFRIRVDDHRIGLFIENDLAEFVRVLPRREIYRKFP
jgi:mRNA interferase RelE/StbE